VGTEVRHQISSITVATAIPSPVQSVTRP
jgi:hypothetical protein